MDSFPITRGWLFIAPIVVGVFAAFGEAVSFYPALIAIVSLFFTVVEGFWNFQYVKTWSKVRKIPICILLFALFFGASFEPLKQLYYKSDEDLRVSFRINSSASNRLTVVYTFLNRGKQSALISGVWLFEIVAMSPKTDPVRYIDLCDDIEPKILSIIQMGQRIMGAGAQVGGEGQKNRFMDLSMCGLMMVLGI